MGMNNGIFEPMFDAGILDEAEEMSRIGESIGDGFERHRQISEMEARQFRHQERQKMLLIERVIDELPETADFLRDHAAARLRAASTLIIDKGLGGTLRWSEGVATRFVAKVADEVYRERLDRVEAMSRLGRKPSSMGSQPPSDRDAARDAAQEALNILYDKVDGAFAPLRSWLARRWQAHEKSSFESLDHETFE